MKMKSGKPEKKNVRVGNVEVVEVTPVITTEGETVPEVITIIAPAGGGGISPPRFLIRTDKPVPVTTRKRALKWPLDRLEVNHSLFIPNAKASSVSSVASAAAKRLNKGLTAPVWAFVTREDHDEINGEQVPGVSIWRVAVEEPSPLLPAPVGESASA